ncbi:citrate-proton symporter [Campylobacter fetus subsp. testudinum]|uniref:tricarballylate/proton symporter TcuC n=1 Tax=Campylobacter fetus TaxID=196 RepID=UPI000818C93B|nr:tricarballylate/proton symporter TcuC [Campylobacter fetus]AVK80355.1 tricarballylate/proton symporter TcuC [Campylobacter fetus subsp. testudinum]MPB72346.1 MFS transporter [Campylobacter fetus]MPB76619.1 MFS transporter [Campylobacter fetus]OCR88435.1 citrate-proton symporter [Campylobacter fetus subsp. testudinum]OCS04307.1 citrate-proton symporter [Campylobacter fetus subsp. testudinum]
MRDNLKQNPAKCSKSKEAGKIFKVASGNFMEMYDFAVYGFYAAFIAQTFFPSDSEFIAVLKSFIAYGVGFLMRPLGAVVLGAFMDKHGRRNGLLLTLSIMALGTFSIAICPSYEQIGYLAPIIVVIGRLLQGFSAGAEVGGASVYLAEIAPKGLRGFYVSWQSGSQQIATIFAGLIGLGMYYLLGDQLTSEWGWRIPFFIGCLIIPFILYIRRSLEETPEFKATAHKAPKTFKAMMASVSQNYKIIILAVMFVMMTTVTFYFITAYTPRFATKALGLTKFDAFTLTAIIGLSNLFWLPLSGYLGDKIGRKPIVLTMTTIGLLTAYPALNFLTSGDVSFTKVVMVELWLSFIFGAYNGVMVVSLSEFVPKEIKALGFSLAYSITVAIFGGFTPVVSEILIEKTKNPASPAYWLTFAAFCSFVSAFILFKKGGVYDKARSEAWEK